MRIIRYQNVDSRPNLAAMTDNDQIYNLPFDDFIALYRAAEEKQLGLLAYVNELIRDQQPLEKSLSELKLLVPLIAQEVWAAGVTYEKSREARNYEATSGKMDVTTFYDKVYDAQRPELFLKSTAARTVGPDEPVYLRSDSNWQIPEPELALVLDRKGRILGYTIGNDMSCRDIEGENPLYLPQAKIWRNSCSIGPAIRLAETVADPYRFQITCRIYRDGKKVVEGSASTGQLKRKYEELVEYVTRDNEIFDGTVLMTGTCIVPPNDFTLQHNDRIEIEISDIGVLHNAVQEQRQAVS